ncbi:hypothetical protein EJ06DRAFT_7756 [Trichodelitschia bisporula]|uniref:ABM domain-containing protein n=1 Tax=Trichodelitschia bisporula TaxID=703511 RepID=A0A6G1I9P1_9PEZI|nr:hypothetical protein EJ06DRAFT_7756 [Trichodelitschia bisporula]
MSDTITALVTLKPAEGKKEEPGCLGYEMYYNEDEGTYLLVETFKDAAAVEEHRNSEWFKKATQEGLSGKLEGPPVSKIVKKVGGFRK